MSDASLKLMNLLDAARDEPAVRERVRAELVSALETAGVDLSSTDLKRWLGLDEASDRELVEVLRARIAVPGIDDSDSGCNCSCATDGA
jgi:hypothetical protein